MRITAFSDKGVESLKRAVVHKPLDVGDVRDSTSKANLDAVRYETNAVPLLKRSYGADS